jgi:hypothetical protein
VVAIVGPVMAGGFEVMGWQSVFGRVGVCK